MAWTRGARVALSIAAPAGLSVLLGFPEAGFWIADGGMLVSMIDRGGTQRGRSRALILGWVLICLAGGVGTVLSADGGLAIPLVALCVFLLGFGSLFSPSTSGATLVGIMTLAVTVADPVEGDALAHAVSRMGLLGLGGAWAVLLGFLFLRWRPTREAQAAVSELYSQLSQLLDQVTQAACAPASKPWEYRTAVSRSSVRSALNSAGGEVRLLRSRIAILGGNSRRLIALYLRADRMIQAIVTLAELLELHHDQESPGEDKVLDLTSSCVANLREVAEQLRVREAGRCGTDAEALIRTMEQLAASPVPNHVKSAALSLGEVVVEAVHTRTVLDDSGIPSTTDVTVSLLQRPPAWWRLRAAFNVNSEVFRYSVRIAVAVAAGMLAYQLLELQYAYWVTLAVLTVVQADLGGTLERSWIAVAGTVLGCGVAALLLALTDSPAVVIALVFVSSLLMGVVGMVHPALYVASVSPIFVLLDNIEAPGSWSIALNRIVNTCLGAGIGIVVAHLLWPQSKREDWKASILELMDACRIYAVNAIEEYSHEEPAQEDLRALYDQASRQMLHAATVTHRLAAQPRRLVPNDDYILGLTVYCTKLIDAGLVLERYMPQRQAVMREAAVFGRIIDEQLRSCITQIRSPSASTMGPESLVPLAASSSTEPFIAREFERIARATSALTATVQSMNTHERERLRSAQRLQKWLRGS